jgi:dipeptidyl aminopeptidase/acylaminoacyl peptidase
LWRLRGRNVDKRGKTIYSLFNLDEIKWDRGKEQLAWISNDSVSKVGVITFKNGINITVIQNETGVKYSSIQWQIKNEGVVFIGDFDDDLNNRSLYFYNIPEKQIYELNQSSDLFPKEGAIIAKNPERSLFVTLDGNNVIFEIQKPYLNQEPLPENLEIWYSNDKLLYPDQKLIYNKGYESYVYVWNYKESTLRPLTDKDRTLLRFTGNQKYALIANPLQYAPQYKLFGDTDYYLIEIATGKMELFLEKQSMQDAMIRFSPCGNYIAYFKDRNWWIYNIVNKEHINITKSIDAVWDNRELDPGNQHNVWGIAGWSNDRNHLLLYDYNDIWMISIDGLKNRRLTNGKETDIQYRFYNSDLETVWYYSGLDMVSVDMTDEKLLSGYDFNSGNSGYYNLDTKGKISRITQLSGATDGLKKATNQKAMAFINQSYDCPPVLYLKNNKQQKEQQLFKSNQHHNKYLWGKSELVHYKSESGQDLSGALFYPADYDTTKSYPLIVWIYETVSKNVHHYINPDIKNPLGFNISNLTLQGYFVMLPDIKYDKGKVGSSAVECVKAAANYVIEKGYTENGKIGLIGQSFGGYETNFIVTQTSLFSAAVSGAGVSDILLHYFTVNLNDNKVDGWRYENQQYRMGTAFYDNQELYFENSPLLYAQNIETPLLIWTGLLDDNVLPEQGLIYYTALRRLNKKCILLRYTDDGHIFVKPKNQFDLTQKVQQWFNYYLKKEHSPEWMDRIIK